MWNTYTVSKYVRLLALASAMWFGMSTPAAAAGKYPDRPVRLIVPYVAGGSTDSTARLVAKGLSDKLNVPFVVVNMPGAGGQIAHAHVANAPADGYTLLFSAAGPLTVTPHSYSKLSYDPLHAFKPIKLVATAPLLLVVNPKSGIKNVQALINDAKKNPNKLTFGSFGVGSAAHLAGELFKSLAKVNIVHVPYKGSAPALTALMAGQIDMMFDVLVTSLPLVQAGKLVPLAVTSQSRVPELPNIPTMSEAGIKGFDAQTWFGLLAPAKTDNAIVQKLSRALDAVMAEPNFRKTIAAQGMEVKGGTPAQFDKFFHSEYVKWGKVAKAANIHMN
ncbi:tripartite tricarboxylate transporter substrate binding protein [Candidimonas humi]|uniref:Bug family tripartite tricarboxylate transporter substrate binding protein n=1 Tax=Candidimonas humi TaxID=683355 RepID=A0ABV8P4T9_9BURK|nr:tripartite tricarboxylate transporter substrate binding protein [Candidimonas humi]MBV6306099.1 tripartite tricarboxylate transporter substrate binding protein [Candidimonas humi]